MANLTKQIISPVKAICLLGYISMNKVASDILLMNIEKAHMCLIFVKKTWIIPLKYEHITYSF